MGILLQYRRITLDKFNHFRAFQTEDLLFDYMYLDHPFLSKHADPKWSTQNHSLDKMYSLVSGFLDPHNDKASIFHETLSHGQPVIGNPNSDRGNSLGVVYFLAPDYVKIIFQAMDAIAENEWPERYRLLMRYDSLEQARARSEFPTYD